MKNVLKIFIVLIAITMTTNSFAQTFGIRSGLNLSNQLWKSEGTTVSDDYNMNPGFHVGATAEFSLSEVFSIESGLILSTKGFKSSREENFGEDIANVEISMNLYYIDIPLMARASVDIGGAKIYGTFGPYIGIGLSGKVDVEETIGTITETSTEDIEFSFDDNISHLRRLDYGLAFGAGVEIKAFQIGVNYGLGLADISNFGDNSSVNNRVLGISLGYRFGL